MAINHYISTGDLIGRGIAQKSANMIVFQVPVNTQNPVDVKDWQCLDARLRQLFDAGYTEGEENAGMVQNFELHLIYVRRDKIPDFTRLLKEQPGPLGWGSLHQFLIDNKII